MFKHPFSDGMTDDSMFKKVFFWHCLAFTWPWCAANVAFLYIIYLYCHKCHYCHWPLFSGLSSVTVVFTLLSSVTAVLSVFVSLVFFPSLCAGGVL